MEDQQHDDHNTVPIGGKIDERDNIFKNPHSYDELPEEVKRFLVDKRKKEYSQRSTIQKLEGKHVLKLILYLDKMSPVTKSDIYNDVARSGNMVGKLEDLSDMGIIDVYSTGRTTTNVVVITKKGRVIADMLREVTDIIDNDDE